MTSETWTAKNVFDPATVKKSITISRWEKLRLLFHKSFWSADKSSEGNSFVRYKIMGGKTYVLEVHYFPAPLRRKDR